MTAGKCERELDKVKAIPVIYQVIRFDFLLVKDFANIKPIGNAISTIQIIVIPIMAIAKLDSISAIVPIASFYLFFYTHRIYVVLII